MIFSFSIKAFFPPKLSVFLLLNVSWEELAMEKETNANSVYFLNVPNVSKINSFLFQIENTIFLKRTLHLTSIIELLKY